MKIVVLSLAILLAVQVKSFLGTTSDGILSQHCTIKEPSLDPLQPWNVHHRVKWPPVPQSAFRIQSVHQWAVAAAPTCATTSRVLCRKTPIRIPTTRLVPPVAGLAATAATWNVVHLKSATRTRQLKDLNVFVPKDKFHVFQNFHISRIPKWITIIRHDSSFWYPLWSFAWAG